jgi:spore cortex biosynthesis protein YabQ
MSPVQQLQAFLAMMGIGIFIGHAFDLYRAWRLVARPGRLATTISDLLFWLLLTPTVFLILLLSNGADLRAYVFAGIFIGILLNLRFLSKATLIFYSRFLLLSGKVLRWLFWVMGWPFRLSAYILSWPLGLCSLLLWYLWQGIKLLTRSILVSIQEAGSKRHEQEETRGKSQDG